jgi:molybdate transport system substrate-binding protein
MATRQLLAELTEAFHAQSLLRISVESVGGVDAAKRVQAGEAFDGVILARNALDALAASGHVQPGSVVDLVRSGVSIAVRAGAPKPAIHDEAAVKQAVLAASSISYSTGPSGVHLARLFERWGIAQEVAGRMVQAPPGVPVGSLVAKGEVALGFQQLSELIHLEGITVLGPLPPALQIITTFSGGVVAASARASQVAEVLAYFAAPAGAGVKRAHGMEPA